MSVWAFCADLHIWNHRAWAGESISGINARGRRCLAVVEEALTHAADMGVTDFAMLGDIFDQSKPPPQLVAALGRVLVKFPTMRKHLLKGNHDEFSTDLGDHALAPFALMPNIHVHERPTVFGDVLFLPFRREPVEEWIHKELETVRAGRSSQKPTILAGHFGLKTSTTPFYLMDALDAFHIDALAKVMTAYGFTRAYVGNWHQSLTRNEPPCKIVQCGTLIPAGFDDQRPGGLFLDSGRSQGDMRYFRSQPIFRVVDFASNAASILGERGTRAPTFVRIKNVPHARQPALVQELDEFVTDGAIEGYEIETVAFDGARPNEVFLPNDHRELAREYLATTFPKDKALQGQVFDALESRYKVFG